MTETLIYIFICLLFSAFFSSIEISFVSVDTFQLTVRRSQEDRIGRLLEKFYDKRDNFLTTTLIGNTISLVVYGVFFAKLMDPPLQQLMTQLGFGDSDIMLLLSQTLVSTGVVLAIAEFTPKYLGLVFSRDIKLLVVLVQVMQPIYFLLTPFTWIVLKTNKLLMRSILGVEKNEEKREIKLEDLSNFLRASQEINDTRSEEEKKEQLEIDTAIFENAIGLQDIKARDCFIPRTDIISMDKEESIEDLRKLFLESGKSKIIIYEGDIDNIVGYCHAIKMYERPQEIEDIISDIPSKPEAIPIIKLMQILLENRKSIAVVTDEFGSTAGIVTIEDIVETIMGEIEDEHDHEKVDIDKIDETTYELHARTKIKELNGEEYNFGIPEGDYDTLGGYVIETLGGIPKQGEILEQDHFIIEFLSIKGSRIEQVRVTLRTYEDPIEQADE
ncbi:MAG: hemolysin family protein [Bacteroidota bacterium]